MTFIRNFFSPKPEEYILNQEKSKGYEIISIKKRGKFSHIKSDKIRLKLGDSNIHVAVNSKQKYIDTNLPTSNLLDKAYKKITGHDRWVPLSIGETPDGSPVYVQVNYASLKKHLFKEGKEALPTEKSELSSAVDQIVGSVELKLFKELKKGINGFCNNSKLLRGLSPSTKLNFAYNYWTKLKDLNDSIGKCPRMDSNRAERVAEFQRSEQNLVELMGKNLREELPAVSELIKTDPIDTDTKERVLLLLRLDPFIESLKKLNMHGFNKDTQDFILELCKKYDDFTDEAAKLDLN